MVAWLNARKVKADVPVLLHASAHLVASRTIRINSARKNKVNWDMTFRISIVRSGVFATKVGKSGCSTEQLYAKKIVDVMKTVVRNAITSVAIRLPRRAAIWFRSRSFLSRSSIATLI